MNSEHIKYINGRDFASNPKNFPLREVYEFQTSKKSKNGKKIDINDLDKYNFANFKEPEVWDWSDGVKIQTNIYNIVLTISLKDYPNSKNCEKNESNTSSNNSLSKKRKHEEDSIEKSMKETPSKKLKLNKSKEEIHDISSITSSSSFSDDEEEEVIDENDGGVYCHLNLERIAIELNKLNNFGIRLNKKSFAAAMLTTNAYTVLIFSSGRIVCTGSQNVRNAYNHLEKLIDQIKRIGYPNIKIQSLRLQNIVARVKLPWFVDIEKFHIKYSQYCRYDHNSFPGAILNYIGFLKNAALIFKSGYLVFTGIKSNRQLREIMRVIPPLIKAFKIISIDEKIKTISLQDKEKFFINSLIKEDSLLENVINGKKCKDVTDRIEKQFKLIKKKAKKKIENFEKDSKNEEEEEDDEEEEEEEEEEGVTVDMPDFDYFMD
jgi:transcription initiation factor TFIID TATA-box-binding protein